MMSEEKWFAARDGEQHGPMAFEALQKMIWSQQIGKDDLVWQIGTPGWIPAGEVPELCAIGDWGNPEVPDLPPTPSVSLGEQYRPQLENLKSRVGELDQTRAAIEALPHLRLLHGLLGSFAKNVGVHQLDLADKLMKRAGSVGYLVAGVLYGLFFAVTSLRADSIQQFMATLLILVPGVTLCHYLAVHFLDSCEDALRRTPTRLSSRTLTMSFGLLTGIVGLLLVISAGQDLFQNIQGASAWLSLAIGLNLIYAAATCLNPSSLNTEMGSAASAGREALELSMVFAKLPLRMASVAFGLFAILSAGTGVFFCSQLRKEELVGLRLVQAVELAPKALLIGLLPLGCYLAALFAILVLDILGAVLETSEGVRDLSRSMRNEVETSNG